MIEIHRLVQQPANYYYDNRSAVEKTFQNFPLIRTIGDLLIIIYVTAVTRYYCFIMVHR